MRDLSRLRGMLARVAVVTALLAGAVGISAAPASAAAFLNGPSTALIWQQTTYTVNSIPAPGTIWLINGNTGQSLASASAGIGAITVPLTFVTPAVPTNMAIYALLPDGSVTNTIPLSVTGVTTTTTIAAPNTARLNAPNNVVVNVQSQSPSTYLPTGTVTIRDGNNTVMTTLNLTQGGSTSLATATWVWTPTLVGTFIFTATFAPAPGTFSAASTSVPDSILVTPSGSNISLTMPPAVFVNVPTTLTATVFPTTTQGSAGFTVNGAPISPSIPLVNGVATFSWTPTVPGQTLVGANFTANTGQTGATSNVVSVGATTQVDVITLAQPGFGTWAPNATYTLGNGTSFTFTASTLSGAQVTLRNSGPCSTTGLTLSITTGSGQCSLVASSPGGHGMAPVSQGYTVTMVPGQQTPRAQVRASGNVNRGTTFTLATRANNVTNAGQPMAWRVTSGGNRCQLRYPSNGSVRLRAVRNGSCNVRATAPAVAGQWSRLVLNRTYRVR